MRGPSRPPRALRHLWVGLLPFALWWLPCVAAAQLNIEALATTVDEPGHHALFNSALSLEAGNVSLFEVTGDAAYAFTNAHPATPEATAAPGFWFRDRMLVNGGAGFKRTPAQRLANDAFIHLRYTRMQWLKVGAEVFAQFQFDEFRLLTRRLVGGVGGRFVFVRVENFAAWMGTGYMIEEERRHIPVADQPPQGPDPEFMVNHRWSNYLTWVALQDTDRVSLANTVYVQPRFDDPADIQILDELSVRASIGERFSLTLGLTVRYDSRAPRSVETYDVKLAQGFTVML